MIGIEKSIFGFYRDSSDEQWNSYRSHLPILLTLAVFFLAISKLIKMMEKPKEVILRFYLISGFVFLIYLFHGHIFKWIVLVCYFDLALKRIRNKALFYTVLWSSAMAVLFINEMFLLEEILPFLAYPIKSLSFDPPVKWNIIFNMTLLRIISYRKLVIPSFIIILDSL